MVMRVRTLVMKLGQGNFIFWIIFALFYFISSTVLKYLRLQMLPAIYEPMKVNVGMETFRIRSMDWMDLCLVKME